MRYMIVQDLIKNLYLLIYFVNFMKIFLIII